MNRFRLLAPLACAATLAGCGSSASTRPANLPNISQVEAAIQGTISSDDHVKANVICPSQVPQIAGETFSCIGVARKPKPQVFVFQVTEHGGTFVSYGLTKKT